MEKHTCPHCGGDISGEIEAAFREQRSKAGKARTEKKLSAQRANAANLNASYTPEKRAAAAAKRLAKIAEKKSQDI